MCSMVQLNDFDGRETLGALRAWHSVSQACDSMFTMTSVASCPRMPQHRSPPRHLLPSALLRYYMIFLVRNRLNFIQSFQPCNLGLPFGIHDELELHDCTNTWHLDAGKWTDTRPWRYWFISLMVMPFTLFTCCWSTEFSWFLWRKMSRSPIFLAMSLEVSQPKLPRKNLTVPRYLSYSMGLRASRLRELHV